MKDLHSKIGIVQLLGAVVASASSTGSAVDLQGFSSAVVVANTGAIAGSGDFTLKLQESDTTTAGDFEDVAAADLLGEFPASLAADAVVKVGYRGNKRYLRHVLTRNSGTSIAVSVSLVKGHPDIAPVA